MNGKNVQCLFDIGSSNNFNCTETANQLQFPIHGTRRAIIMTIRIMQAQTRELVTTFEINNTKYDNVTFNIMDKLFT
ncbi:hypothetical protein GJ496_007519 [Pomphorhynchus laevis]|nr:hypothetical protein GJ496_007519 [Pomphorhynchus laevis]